MLVKHLSVEGNIMYVAKPYDVGLSPLGAANRAIETITALYPPPYYVYVSGGLDSQAMLYCWLQSGISFIPVCFRYNTDLNSHDLKTLSAFAHFHKIKIHYVDIDVIKFLDTEHHKYAVRYLCGSPHYTTYMKMTEIINDGTVIHSGDPSFECKIKIASPNGMSLLRFRDNCRQHFVPYFFSSTPEIMYGMRYQTTPEGHDKFFQYKACGFDLIRPVRKYTGFEQIKDYYEEHRGHQVSDDDFRIRLPSQGSRKVFDVLFRNKYEYMFRNANYQIEYI